MPPPKRRITATYPYVDESGRLLFEVVRYEPKDFRQRRPNGNGGWTYNLDGTRRVLYRLPDVIAAVERGDTVWVCAGEKDADRLAAEGVAATTNPMGEGSGKWLPEYSEALIGASTVVVAVDPDETGRRHAIKVVESLRAYGIEANPVWPQTGDVFDHFEAGYGIGDFEPATELLEDDEPANDGKPSADLLVDMSAALEAAEEDVPYVIEPIAARGHLTLLVGRHSSFKSWLMMLFGAAAHRGERELAGFTIERATALYVDAENGPRLMGRRFRAAGIPATGLLIADGMKLKLPGDAGRLRDLIEYTGAGLVVLDSLRRLAPGAKENDSDDMAQIVSAVGEIARDLDVAIVMIHHRSSKTGAAIQRGSSAIEDQADCVFLLEQSPGDKLRGRRKLSTVKFRPDEDPPPRWLRLGALADGTFTLEPAEGLEDEDGGEEPTAAANLMSASADRPRRSVGMAVGSRSGSPRRSGLIRRAAPSSGPSGRCSNPRSGMPMVKGRLAGTGPPN